jgi:hypothetical protein
MKLTVLPAFGPTQEQGKLDLKFVAKHKRVLSQTVSIDN